MFTRHSDILQGCSALIKQKVLIKCIYRIYSSPAINKTLCLVSPLLSRPCEEISYLVHKLLLGDKQVLKVKLQNCSVSEMSLGKKTNKYWTYPERGKRGSRETFSVSGCRKEETNISNQGLTDITQKWENCISV